MSRSRPLLLVLLLLALSSGLFAAASESLADRTLKDIAERQKSLLADAARMGDRLDQEAFRSQVESLCHDYEAFLRSNPDSSAGYTAYGYLLSKVGMRKDAAAILLKANQLDPNIPLVKNQLGNYLAEEGKPLEAVNYYLSAVKLEPKEPLYHYQLGTLLYEARADFIKSGEWTQVALEHSMHEAFRQAAELAPDRFEFVYRYAESFADVQNPDWEAALKVWGGLEAQAKTSIERQALQLQEANVYLKWGKPDKARVIIDGVVEPELQGQKEKLVAQLPQTAKN